MKKEIILPYIILFSLSVVSHAHAGISDIQFVKGKCSPGSHIAEGDIGEDLTERQSRFYCDSAVISFFDDHQDSFPLYNVEDYCKTFSINKPNEVASYNYCIEKNQVDYRASRYMWEQVNEDQRKQTSMLLLQRGGSYTTLRVILNEFLRINRINRPPLRFQY